jgi:hypothetical protein
VLTHETFKSLVKLGFTKNILCQTVRNEIIFASCFLKTSLDGNFLGPNPSSAIWIKKSFLNSQYIFASAQAIPKDLS